MTLVAAGETDAEIASGLAVRPLDVAVVTLETS